MLLTSLSGGAISDISAGDVELSDMIGRLPLFPNYTNRYLRADPMPGPYPITIRACRWHTDGLESENSLAKVHMLDIQIIPVTS